MTPEERARIYSQEYVDLIVDFYREGTSIEGFEDETIHILDANFAIIHVSIEQFESREIFNIHYSNLPSVFGVFNQGSLDASGITQIRERPDFNLRGEGVLIGIIDTGIDYTNPVFQYSDGTTRIAAIWDQSIPSDTLFPFETQYGTEFSREQINEALQSENPLEIVPVTDEVGHGTMLAGIAAGNMVEEENFVGVVPASELLVVKLKPAKNFIKDFFMIPRDAVGFQENDIMFGLKYLLDKSRDLNKPIAICIALGSSQGAHDGRGTLSSYLSRVSERNDVAVVVGAGNEGNARRHYYGVVDPAIGYDEVELRVGVNEAGFSMELWGESPSTFSIDILSPSGEYVPRIPARLVEDREISFVFEETRIFLNYEMVESQSGDQLILMRFQNPTAGIWRFRVYGTGDLTLGFHIWLPMEGFISNETYFSIPNPYTTVLSLGNAFVPITATAYNENDDSIFLEASRGFSRIGSVTPDIAAPGVNLIAPTVNQRFVLVSGTSAAAAHTTGVAAMMLEWGVVKGNFPAMNTIEIKKFLIRGAKRTTSLTYPNPIWGYGILDIFNTFDVLRSEVE
ncbi:MAG: S8 family peptidase [Clostridiales bacterium]|nr:S8 family peptidase [Clostridiales bacterium]